MDFNRLVHALITNKAQKATFYVSPTKIIRAVARGKTLGRGNIEVTPTIGIPNYLREFIRKCKKAGEPFPVKKIQLKFLPK
jgi:hypothetical protein